MSNLERLISLVAPGWAYRRRRMRQALEELEQPRRAPLPRMADYLDPRSQVHSAGSAVDGGIFGNSEDRGGNGREAL